MKKIHVMAWPKLCSMLLLGASAMFMASCAQDGFDNNEAFYGTITSGDQLVSPNAGTFKVKSSADRSTQTISWSAVTGALDYKVWVYKSDAKIDDTNPGEVMVSDSLVHNPYVAVPRAKNTYYRIEVMSAENKAENNPGADTKTEYKWDTFMIEITVSNAAEDGGGDFYKYLQMPAHTIAKAIADNGGKECPVYFYFKPDVEYTISDEVDFEGHEVILCSESEDTNKLPVIKLDAKATIKTYASLQLKNLEINGANVVKKALITLHDAPQGEQIKSHYHIESIIFDGVKLTDITGSILTDSKQPYCVVKMSINNCIFKLETEAVTNESLIDMYSGSQSGMKDFEVLNSTIYGNGDNAKYFLRYNNSARIDRYGFDSSDHTTMTYKNNTFYNLLNSEGQWGNYSGIQNSTIYVVTNNIWVNCGAGESARRLLSGGRIGSSEATWLNNTYWHKGAAKDQSQYDTSAALTTDPNFKNPAGGDFTPQGSDQLTKKTGDPRWIPAN